MSIEIDYPSRQSVTKQIKAEALQQNLLLSGISTNKQFISAVDSGLAYAPSLFFPLGERAKDAVIRKELFEVLLDAKMTRLFVELSLKETERISKDLYESAVQASHEITSVTTRVSDRTSLGQSSVGSVRHIQKTMEFHSGEMEESSDFYLSDAGYATLPIESKEIASIASIDCYVNGERLRRMSTPFFLSKSTSEQRLKFSIKLDRERVVNSLEIPVSIPLSRNIESLKLIDKSSAVVRHYSGEELKNWTSPNGVFLHLIVPPTRVREIEIIFEEDLYERELSLFPSSQDAIGLLNLVDSFVKVGSSFGSASTERTSDKILSHLKEDSDLKEDRHILLGILPVVSLIQFKEEGRFGAPLLNSTTVLGTKVQINGDFVSEGEYVNTSKLHLDLTKIDALASAAVTISKQEDGFVSSKTLPHPLCQRGDIAIMLSLNRTLTSYGVPLLPLDLSKSASYSISKSALLKKLESTSKTDNGHLVKVTSPTSLFFLALERKAFSATDVTWDRTGLLSYKKGIVDSVGVSVFLKRRPDRRWHTPIIRSVASDVFVERFND